MNFQERLNHIAVGIGLKAASVNKPDKHRGDRVAKYITPRAIRRAKRDINDWRRAQQRAEHPDTPRRNLYINLCRELILDGHLTGQWMGRRSRAIGGSFTIYKDGEPMPELTELIDKPWFYETLGHFFDAKGWGHSLVEVDDYTPLKGQEGGIKSVKLIKREHVVPEHGLLLQNETDTDGIEYRESEYTPWIFETANKTDLGFLNICAPYLLYKRYALAANSEYTELYGIPPRIGKTDIRDKELVTEMANTLHTMGSSLSGVIDIDDEIVFMEQKGTQSDQAFTGIFNRCNNEVSKTVSGTVVGEADAGGSRSKEEVGERTQALVARDDRHDIEQQVNHQIIPKLILLGYPFEGCTWSLDDDVNVDGLFGQVKDLLPYGDVDPEFIEEKFGIPWKPCAGSGKPDPDDTLSARGFF